MDTIGALKFADLLADDPLYCNCEMLKVLINSLAIEHAVQLYFCGYLYGAKRVPIQRLHVTINYIPYDDHSEEKSLDKTNCKQPSVFRPYDKYLKSEIESLRGRFPDESEYILELDKIRQCVIRSNSFQVQFVTTLLSCKLEFINGNIIQKFGAAQLEELINSDFNGCLIDALNSFVLTSGFISEFFSKNLLPLPVALFPSSSSNADLFAKKYKLSNWDGHDVRSDFKQFYSEQSIHPSKVHSHGQAEGESIAYASQSILEESVPVAAEINSNKEKNSHAFYKCGQQWEIIFNGKRSLLNDSVGLNYIHRIICAGMNGISVYELAATRDKSYVSQDDKLFDSPQNSFETQDTSRNGKRKSINQEDLSEALEILEDKKLKLEHKKTVGEIDDRDYDAEMKRLNELMDIAYDTNRSAPDSNKKKAYDRVTKSIQRALESIKTNNKELFGHLDSYCKPKGSKYCYTGLLKDISWKLYP